jgi:IPT/TIG domain
MSGYTREWQRAYVGPDLTETDDFAPSDPEVRDEAVAAYEAEVEAAEEHEESLERPEVAVSPTLSALEPNTAQVGGPDVVMSCIGTGFVPDSKIFFNGGEEPTTFVDETEVTTVVKPSTASGPWTVPVHVRNPNGEVTVPQNFTFTEVPQQYRRRLT